MAYENVIAPCGMNCSLCIAYQFMQGDLNQFGLKRTYCPGCIDRGKHCTLMAHHCELVGKGKVRFCYECDTFPCKRLKALDHRYRTKYGMSMIDNLHFIKEHGTEAFLLQEDKKWTHETCGHLRTCHGGMCLHCNIDALKSKKPRGE